MDILQGITILIFLFLIELLYFRIADRFNIIDKPNHRSSHNKVTIRGGGIIFTIAAQLFFVLYGFPYPYFMLGLFLITTISFLDDILTLSNKVRLAVHLISVVLMFVEWQLFDMPWYWTAAALVFVIGTINAYNFMDGINGITGAYSLVTTVTLYYINTSVVEYTSSGMLMFTALALLVFNYFNFRFNARCFAGDVGSVSIAFILLFHIGQLVIKTENPAWILLLLIYGLDAVITIVFRLIRRENIFEAHRTHFYQYLVNEAKGKHIYVATGYAITQLIVNLFLIRLSEQSITTMIFATGLTTALFILLRLYIEGKDRLLKRTKIQV
ncbi:MraY family glycosyltransferase [Pedobacter faecalis]|uniref:MraY family glycosyltransferase n=1 Tax=Pedobacter faecalis TaxID=3041495 RepID=UPI002549C5AD|nr:glycosyltransferase family 4 protein [Pedobacter sp. ELA7]